MKTWNSAASEEDTALLHALYPTCRICLVSDAVAGVALAFTRESHMFQKVAETEPVLFFACASGSSMQNGGRRAFARFPRTLFWRVEVARLHLFEKSVRCVSGNFLFTHALV